MTDSDVPVGREWSYRFTKPDEVEITTRDMNGDEAAETLARELSKAANSPVVVHRLQRLANSWEYVIEVDEHADVI